MPQPHLLTLPTEIKDLIFFHVFNQTSVLLGANLSNPGMRKNSEYWDLISGCKMIEEELTTIDNNHIEYTGPSVQQNASTYPVACLFFVSKQMYADALPVFYKECHFDLSHVWRHNSLSDTILGQMKIVTCRAGQLEELSCTALKLRKLTLCPFIARPSSMTPNDDRLDDFARTMSMCMDTGIAEVIVDFEYHDCCRRTSVHVHRTGRDMRIVLDLELDMYWQDLILAGMRVRNVATKTGRDGEFKVKLPESTAGSLI